MTMTAVTSRLPSFGLVLARFSTVSVASTALTLVTIGVLTDVSGVSNAEAAAIATLCGFACSYPMTRNWVFGGGAKADHAVAILWLGGLSVLGVVASTVAGAAVDALARSAQLDGGTTLAYEEVTESVVLGAIFAVRFVIARALFDGRRQR